MLDNLLAPAIAFVLAVVTVACTEVLLAYIRHRDASAEAKPLPVMARLALGLVTFAAIALLVAGRPVTPLAATRAVWVAVLAVVFVIDLRTHLILDIVTGPVVVLSLLASVAFANPNVQQALLGGVAGFVIFGLIFGLGLLLFRRAAIGLGDVKFAAVIGTMVGASNIGLALIIGIVLGGVVSLGLLVSGRAKLSDAPAYGTYMAIGAFTALLQLAAGTGQAGI